MTDTLIVERNGKYKIEKYKNQNLDEYNYIAEMNHNRLCTDKTNNIWYMENITLDEIFDYLKNNGWL